MNNDFYGQQPENSEVPVKRNSRLGLLSMICGIAGMAGVLVEFSIVAVILSLSARRRDGSFNTKSRLGFIFGLVGLGITLVASVFLVFFFKQLAASGGLPDISAFNGLF